jgi:serine/threonine protein kinase
MARTPKRRRAANVGERHRVIEVPATIVPGEWREYGSLDLLFCAFGARFEDGRPVQLSQGLNVAERFLLVRELGRGGMGAVWLAQDTRLDVLCAIKFIDREGQNSPEVRQRFQREAKAAAQLRSPHVVQILDHGVWDNLPYIAMEYMDGEDLAHRLDRVGRLSWGETARIATHVARALSKAHGAGIVHRDMKPENIFLARDDDGELAKVLDFGIAKRQNQQLSDVGTKTGSLLGTPFYMSPEQARGTKSIDYRSDLFSLAVIIYQCLTGQLPFYSEGLGDILAQIMYEPIPVPSQKAPDLPPTFDAWWARASAREPEERFQSAKELAETLAVALRLSDPVEITAIAPRVQAMSSPDLAGSSPRIRVPAGGSPGGPTLALSVTTDKPVVRNYEPESSGRKKGIVFIASGLAVIAAGAGLFVLRGNSPPLGQASGSREVVVATPVAPAPEPDVPVALPAESIETLTPGAPPRPGPSAAPKRPRIIPPPKPPGATTTPGKRDYGI